MMMMMMMIIIIIIIIIAKRAKNLDAKHTACETAFVHYGSTMFH